MSEITEKGKIAKSAALQLAVTSTKIKDFALERMAEALDKNAKYILQANALDLEAGEKKEISRALLDRLALDGKRIKGMIDGLNIVRSLPDPIGETLAEWTRPNGLKIKKVRVPIGVIGIIYEARPNVTVDSAALCIKAGNAVILRGGSNAMQSNIEIAKIISDAGYNAGLPEGSIQLIADTKRESVTELTRARGLVDVIILRGGKQLINMAAENATVPVIETGEGNCHAYVEKSADLEMALEIVFNAKCSRPSVCNAIETLIVDEAIAAKFLPMVKNKLDGAQVELRCDEKAHKILPGTKLAKEEDWKTEFLSLIMAVKVVSGLTEAIDHINTYGTKHSEAIITTDEKAAKRFTDQVDAATVYVNASTRFTDGFEFGFGAEIGISNQKLHARGPMGLPELTSYKYIVHGTGQVRQ
jgi:glutamate-5-semialdehyde dehydrogenase